MERPTFSASNMKTWTGCAWNISFLCWYGADGEENQLRTSLISYTSIVNFSMVSWFNILNQLKGWMIGCCCLLNYIFTSCIVARLEKVHLKEVKKCENVYKGVFQPQCFCSLWKWKLKEDASVLEWKYKTVSWWKLVRAAQIWKFPEENPLYPLSFKTSAKIWYSFCDWRKMAKRFRLRFCKQTLE